MTLCLCNTQRLNGEKLALDWSDLCVLACSSSTTAAIIELLQKSDQTEAIPTQDAPLTGTPREMRFSLHLFRERKGFRG